MKQLLVFAAVAATVFAVIAARATESFAAPKNVLIAYFSRSGNTLTIARQIQKAAGGDLFEIATAKPYPKDYHATVDLAQKELRENARPALKTAKVPNLASYDFVFIGSPNWWGTLPTPVMTFLEENDMSGRTVAQFITHEGSGFGRSERDLKKLCPKSKIVEGIEVRGGSVNSAQDDVSAWVKKIGASK